MPLFPKYKTVFIIQGSFYRVWEDLSEYEADCWKEAHKDLMEYRIAAPDFAHRIIRRRVLNEEVVS